MLKEIGEHRLALPSGDQVAVNRFALSLPTWTGDPVRSTWNNKPILDLDGIPVFAELALVALLEQDGWRAAWASSGGYYRGNLINGRTKIELPPPHKSALERICKGTRAGIWDVIVWRGEQRRYYELKWSARDKIRPAQIAWLASAVDLGESPQQFGIVEFSMLQST